MIRVSKWEPIGIYALTLVLCVSGSIDQFPNDPLVMVYAPLNAAIGVYFERRWRAGA